MNLTKGQQQALDAFRDLGISHPNGGGVCIVNGPAGTGKTSLLRVLAETDGILVLAPTGKAALRAAEVAGCRASTIHKWMYSVKEDQNTGNLDFTSKDLIDIELPKYHAIVIDEASMVTFDLYKDLLETCSNVGKNLILIGDEFQLPPVDTENAGFSVFLMDADYRVNLSEVLRQAEESIIIKVATAVRTSNSFALQLSDVPSVDKTELIDKSIDIWSKEGMVICHTNETRHRLNQAIRKTLGRMSRPEDTEPLLIIKNNYINEVLNGEVYVIKRVVERIETVKVTDRFTGQSDIVDYWYVELVGGKHCLISQQELQGEMKISPSAASNGCKKLLKRKKSSGVLPESCVYVSANYGYVLSCHKSQGSEANDVLVVLEETVKPFSMTGRRWLYTALTRSKQNLSVCWY